jgi:Tol biopolymer transport system component
VAFGSYAWNLVSGDTNGRVDVFVHDRATGVTERVSVDSGGAEANDDAGWSSLSADGRFVVFASWATNLVPNDTNNLPDVFVHDRATGVTEIASVDSGGAYGNGMSFFCSISADGRFVAFDSRSSNLVSGDTNGGVDIFVRDRFNGTTERVSVDSFGNQGDRNGIRPAISADGTMVAFVSDSTNLVPGDTNVEWDVFVHDRSTGLTERVSVDSSGNEGNDTSNYPSISPDGQVVAFVSYSTNLDPNDTNSYSDVYVHERGSGVTECVSLNTSGTGANDDSFAQLGLSADGRFAAFTSSASDLVTNDTNYHYDVFVRDRVAGVTERASVDSAGAQGDRGSVGGSLSSSGEQVAFFTDATNLVTSDTNRASDAMVRDRCDALWLNYGTGFSGTHGIPDFTAQTDPVFGSMLTLDLSNSYGVTTTGVVLIGFARMDIATPRGGDLLVVPAFTIFLSIPVSGALITGTVPSDPSFFEFAIDLQGLEIDLGAAKGVSFTRGLELILGN